MATIKTQEQDELDMIRYYCDMSLEDYRRLYHEIKMEYARRKGWPQILLSPIFCTWFENKYNHANKMLAYQVEFTPGIRRKTPAQMRELFVRCHTFNPKVTFPHKGLMNRIKHEVIRCSYLNHVKA